MDSAREGERDAPLGHGKRVAKSTSPHGGVSKRWWQHYGDVAWCIEREREHMEALACSMASHEGRAATHHGEIAARTMNGGAANSVRTRPRVWRWQWMRRLGLGKGDVEAGASAL